MTEAEAIHRGWVVFWIGWAFLVLTGVQIWTGKTVAKGGRTILRKKEPKSFWFGVFLTSAIWLWCWGLGLSRIL
jgi:hypothetical protein